MKLQQFFFFSTLFLKINLNRYNFFHSIDETSSITCKKGGGKSKKDHFYTTIILATISNLKRFTLKNFIILRYIILALAYLIFLISEGFAGETDYHDLDQPDSINIAYKKGVFKLHDEGDTTFSKPYQPTKLPEQSVQFYKQKALLPISEETILKKVIPGEDGRKRIIETTKWPYSIHGQLNSNFPNGDRCGGSGVLVGPHHVLTAAHNVYKRSRGGYVNAVSFHSGLNDTSQFCEAKGVRVYTFSKWVNDGNVDYDMALITLNRSVGSDTGWGGLLFSNDNEDLGKKEIHIMGYPSDKKEYPSDKNSTQMWTMSDKIQNITQERFYYNIDTYEGQSGSGICTNVLLQPYVLGVHVRGESVENQGQGNSGTRLSLSKILKIKKWVSKTFEIQENKQDVPLKIKQTLSDDISSKNKKTKLTGKRERNHSERKNDPNPNSKKKKLPHNKKSLEVIAKELGFDFQQKDDVSIARNILKGLHTLYKSQGTHHLKELSENLMVSSSTLRNFISGKQRNSPTIVTNLINDFTKKKSFFHKPAKELIEWNRAKRRENFQNLANWKVSKNNNPHISYKNRHIIISPSKFYPGEYSVSIDEDFKLVPGPHASILEAQQAAFDFLDPPVI